MRLCYDLADLLNNEQASEFKGLHRTAAWDSERQRLTLRENETQEIVLDAEWDEVEERWKETAQLFLMQKLTKLATPWSNGVVIERRNLNARGTLHRRSWSDD